MPMISSPASKFPDRWLHPDDMPHAAARRTAGAAEGVNHLADATSGVNLRVGQIRRISRAGQTIKRETYDRIEASNGEDRLKVSVTSCFGWVTVAPQHSSDRRRAR